MGIIVQSPIFRFIGVLMRFPLTSMTIWMIYLVIMVASSPLIEFSTPKPSDVHLSLGSDPFNPSPIIKRTSKPAAKKRTRRISRRSPQHWGSCVQRGKLPVISDKRKLGVQALCHIVGEKAPSIAGLVGFVYFGSKILICTFAPYPYTTLMLLWEEMRFLNTGE
ncbi:Hypothetical predicted protein [Prunus dulcis]|uniref:Uncharacterized protein n=1 Tax=Prunus dulcis TaxID=3755 RepID=A0A5E4FLQ8_PRUDU|nr:Hypothetical predicted protein [Prunus dulcis]